jgi:integrase
VREKKEKKQKRYGKTPFTNLIRSTATGVYFLNASVGGKLHQYSLETTDAKVAQKKRDEEIAQIRKSHELGNDGKASLTLQEAMDIWKEEIIERGKVYQKSNDGFSPKTVRSYLDNIDRLSKYIPAEAFNRPLRSISNEELRKWVRPIQMEFSATVYNTCRAHLKRCYEIGIQKCACHSNHAAGLPFSKPAKKDLILPTNAEWVALIENIRAGADPKSVAKREIVRAMIEQYTAQTEVNYEKAFSEHPEWRTALALDGNATKAMWHKVYDMAHYIKHEENNVNRRGQESADLVEFMSYTGCRIGETVALTWDRVDFERRQMIFSATTVKGGETTKVLTISSALSPILERCKARARIRGGDKKVWGIKNCSKAITNACKRLGFRHWTQHDFRHLHATKLIEAGATLQEVGKRLGHKDDKTAHKYLHANIVRADRIAETIDLRREVVPAAPTKGEAAAKDAEIATLKAKVAALEASAEVKVLNA